MLDDWFCKAARGVVRAGAAAVSALSDVNAAGVDDNRVAQRVFPQQRGVGMHTIKQSTVVPTGDKQVLFVGQFFVGDRLLERLIAAACYFLQELRQFIQTFSFEGFEFRQRNFRFTVLSSPQPQHRFGCALGRVIQ